MIRTRVCLALLLLAPGLVVAQQPKPVIPHAQDQPPNDPRDPQTAARMMKVPEGFTVEVVAAEPDIVNPVAMTIDEKGRFWITESLEYPRRQPGPGQDRVKVLEDTNADGVVDKTTVFLEGLNIPSGIAVGHGGVWIANAPELLFVRDTDGDGRADQQEVIVTGFGRTDTHELPNSLTWGPDGWLYGLNGVFNHSHVKYSPTNPNFKADHPGWPLTCALFRIHPRTREFQVFCEGTSNPWGVAFNEEGDAFVSACVIDHLWHLVESGYYHRQGGPYPPFTWKIDSIVKHKHQKAAYCGIHYFDSDAYPEAYRRRLYMGNIHGGCLNVDRIERDGSTYRGLGDPDFLTANDAWFMPVVQKTGPDGCLYVLDWYDRYHCYQDANRDPAGIDRLKGRLYRVRYRETPRTPRGFDLSRDSDEQLITRLGAGNDYVRSTALRLLQERNTRAISEQLGRAISDPKLPREQRLQAVFALAGVSDRHDWYPDLIQDTDPTIRAWAIRMMGDDPTLRARILIESQRWTRDPSPQVLLQAVITVAKALRSTDADPESLALLLSQSTNDRLIPHIVWQNLHPLLETRADAFLKSIARRDLLSSPPVVALMPRVMDRILGRKTFVAAPVVQMIQDLARGPASSVEVAAACLDQLATKVQNREITGDHQTQLRTALMPLLETVFQNSPKSPLYLPSVFLATALGEPTGIAAARAAVESSNLAEEQRLAALGALVSTAKPEALACAAALLESSTRPAPEFRGKVLTTLARLDDPAVATLALRLYPTLETDLQPRVIDLLTQRAAWARQLLQAMGARQIAPSAMNLNQARRLKELKDEELTGLLAAHWGQVREGRDPDRDRYVTSMKALIRRTPGDPLAGERAFKKVCAQCHKLYGEGQDVGPDLTRNGRNDFTQLVSNVFDPSLVIGAGYRAYTVVTADGRVINGLLVEDSPQRVVLKVAGGKQEVIARADVDEAKVNEISLMPEQLEKQLMPQEIADLFAFLTLDKHPSDPTARRLPGVNQVAPKESVNPADYPALVAEILPGFTTTESGELGVGLLASHAGRDNVLRTHPVTRDKPCVLSMQLTPAAGKKTQLVLDVSHDPRGDWRLVIRGNGQRMADEMISRETCPGGWRTLTVDLSKFAGQELKLDLVNQANDWSWEFAYWGSARIVTE